MSTLVPPDRPANPRFQKALQLEGPLADQLAAYDAMLKEANPATWQAYQGLVKRLAELKVGAGAPQVGDVLPGFALPADDGRLVMCSELLAKGPLVLSFNRGNWCPFCWLELSALQRCHRAIVAQGASLVSITPDIATFSRRLKKRLGLDFPVLTDLDSGYALDLGLAFALNDEVREVYERAGIDLEAFQRTKMCFLPVPAILVVDRNGVVRHAYVNVDFRERLEPETIAGLLSGL